MEHHYLSYEIHNCTQDQNYQKPKINRNKSG